jgi:hypothetical protein
VLAGADELVQLVGIVPVVEIRELLKLGGVTKHGCEYAL